MKRIKENISNEIIINNSRFITHLIKVYNEEQALKEISDVKKQYKDATHYCYAYVIDNIIRFNDDKEPSGTAGKPILDILIKNNLNYVICIVVRYFGGLKLGRGGLTRAYVNSVTEALKKTVIEELVVRQKLKIIFPYHLIKEIDYLLKNCLIIKKNYDQNITYIVLIENEIIDRILSKLKTLEGITIENIGESYN